MKEKIAELGKTIIAVILAILIMSLMIYILGSIVINIFEIPIKFTYLRAIGFIVGLSTIRFIVKFLIEGLDFKELLKKTNNNIPDKKYKFEISYKNKAETTGEITANNLDEVKEILLNNKCTIANKGKKLVYYNSDEIQFCEVEEIEN